MNQSWQPILDRRLRNRALEIVENIADDLGRGTPKDPSLSSGSAGLAILYAYLKRAREQKKYRDAAIDGLQTVRMGPSLYSGFTGIAWTLAHLEKRNGKRLTESDVDGVLSKYLQLKPWR